MSILTETRSIMNAITLYIISLLVIMITAFSGCVNYEENPVGSFTNSISIGVTKPVSGDSISYKGTKIEYSVTGNAGVKFIQLFINGEYAEHINPDPNSSGSLPAFTLNLDSTLIGSRISFYLIFYDNSANGSFSFSDTVKNLLVTENTNPPGKPYNFKLFRLTETSINLSWSDSSGGINGYEIFRKIAGQSYSDAPYLIAGPGSFNINDESMVPGVSYFYKMRAVNLHGKSDFTNEINTAGAGGSGSVAPPSEVKAQSSGPKTVRLTWKDNSYNENYFGIERRPSFSSDFQRVGIVANNITSFTDTTSGLTAGLDYYYRIKAYSNSDSSWSGEAFVKVVVVLLTPPVITSLTNPSNTRVLIKWKDNDPGFTYFHIYRRTEGVDGLIWLAEVEDYKGQYEDPLVEPNKTYYYKIQSTEGNGFSEFSDEVSITTRVVNLLPPTITLYFYAGGNKINLSWSFDQVAGKFIIERRDLSVSPPTLELIEVDGSLRTYVDYVDACNKNFDYRIRAVDDFSTSGYSAPVTVVGGCW
ncbi:MAG: fibronectin type III domain-containing protein [Ignavibacteriaceae bacterium]